MVANWFLYLTLPQFSGILIYILVMKHLLKKRELGDCSFSVHHMNPWFLWWVCSLVYFYIQLKYQVTLGFIWGEFLAVCRKSFVQGCYCFNLWKNVGSTFVLIIKLIILIVNVGIPCIYDIYLTLESVHATSLKSKSR